MENIKDAYASSEGSSSSYDVVERVVGRRRRQEGGLQYRLKWLNYPDEENTWEDVEDLKCLELVAEFEAAIQVMFMQYIIF